MRHPESYFQIRSPLGPFWSRTLLGLIEGVYDQYPDQARKILREWIECSREPTFLEREITKVAAKRIRLNADLKPEGIELFSPAQVEVNKGTTDPRYKKDRDIWARLIDSNGVTLLQCANTNGKIKTRHAEMNLIQGFGKKFPAESHLFVSLKPCRMCAAAIWENAEDIENFRVIYVEDDPGPHAKETLLDLNSAARRRLFGKDSPYLNLKVQSQRTN